MRRGIKDWAWMWFSLLALLDLEHRRRIGADGYGYGAREEEGGVTQL